MLKDNYLNHCMLLFYFIIKYKSTAMTLNVVFGLRNFSVTVTLLPITTFHVEKARQKMSQLDAYPDLYDFQLRPLKTFTLSSVFFRYSALAFILRAIFLNFIRFFVISVSLNFTILLWKICSALYTILLSLGHKTALFIMLCSGL